jgi:hypothetical protein
MASVQTFLSIPETAERLRNAGFKVSAPQVRSWVRNGKFGDVPRLPNGRAQIPCSAVDALISPAPQA